MNTIDAALICKALGDANRLEIMKMISKGEICACKILEQFSITQPTLSYHMKMLYECDLIKIRKEGRWTHYSLNAKTLQAFQTIINSLTAKNKKGGRI